MKCSIALVPLVPGNLRIPIRRKFIQNELTTKFSLIRVIKVKATCSVTNLFNPLHYHWCQDANSTSHGRCRIQQCS